MPSSVRYTTGGVTVTLSGELAEWARAAVDEGERELVQQLVTIGDEEASKARGLWYQQVDRRTGKSGDIQSVLVLSDTEARVSVGSTDTRVAGRKPVPLWVHRPGPFSVKHRSATEAETTKGKGKRVTYPNPKASDGKFLVVELIRKPVRARFQVEIQNLGRALANAMRRAA